MNGQYILDDDGHPVPEPDLYAWGRWYETSREKRIVARTVTALHEVSTVFLALDHGWGRGPPILWETMVFQRDSDGGWQGSLDDIQWRYRSRAEALQGHQDVVEEIRRREAEAQAVSNKVKS
jgi:hypothetical protein